jgi:hypothetical protein
MTIIRAKCSACDEDSEIRPADVLLAKDEGGGIYRWLCEQCGELSEGT